MQKITAAESLKTSVLVIKRRQNEEEKLLKEQFSTTYESLKPLTVLRKVVHEMTSPSVLKDNLIQTSTALISGYLSRKMLVRSSKNPLLRLAGIFVQYGVTNFVANNSASIKTIGHYFINKFTCNCREKKKLDSIII